MIDPNATTQIFAGIFVALIFHAIITDVRYLVIKNWVSLALLVSFFLYTFFAKQPLPVAEHILSALLVFAVGFLLFILRWIAGGDVKFMAAVGLWAGPDLIAEYSLYTAILGSLLACGVFAVRWLDRYGEAVGMPSSARCFMPAWAKRGLCPYGIAIGLAAFIVLPVRFG
jgi:prepilin peptidase CpaA